MEYEFFDRKNFIKMSLVYDIDRDKVQDSSWPFSKSAQELDEFAKHYFKDVCITKFNVVKIREWCVKSKTGVFGEMHKTVQAKIDIIIAWGIVEETMLEKLERGIKLWTKNILKKK